MKCLNTIGIILIVIGAAGITGCFVPESQLREAQAVNNRLLRDKQKLKADVEELRAQNEELEQELAERGPVDEQVRLLEQEYAQLRSDYDDLNIQYQQLLVRDPPDALPQPVSLELQRLAEQYSDVVEFSPRHGMIKLKADLTFSAGSVSIKPAARDALAQLATIVNSPKAEPFNIYIAGHTDDMRIVKETTLRHHPNNWYLSVHRAIEVQKLLEADGVGADRIAVMGFGQHQPVAPNADNRRGNPLNRRVEIWLVPSGQFLTVSP